jgi:hypothetical protein
MNVIQPAFNFITTITANRISIKMSYYLSQSYGTFSPNEHTLFSSILYILLELLHSKIHV